MSPCVGLAVVKTSSYCVGWAPYRRRGSSLECVCRERGSRKACVYVLQHQPVYPFASYTLCFYTKISCVVLCSSHVSYSSRKFDTHGMSLFSCSTARGCEKNYFPLEVLFIMATPVANGSKRRCGTETQPMKGRAVFQSVFWGNERGATNHPLPMPLPREVRETFSGSRGLLYLLPFGFLQRHFERENTFFTGGEDDARQRCLLRGPRRDGDASVSPLESAKPNYTCLRNAGIEVCGLQEKGCRDMYSSMETYDEISCDYDCGPRIHSWTIASEPKRAAVICRGKVHRPALPGASAHRRFRWLAGVRWASQASFCRSLGEWIFYSALSLYGGISNRDGRRVARDCKLPSTPRLGSPRAAAATDTRRRTRKIW